MLGETKTFKAHMEIAHNIFFNIGSFLALNLTILNNQSVSKILAKDPGKFSVSIPQDADLKVSRVDQICGMSSKNNF